MEIRMNRMGMSMMRILFLFAGLAFLECAHSTVPASEPVPDAGESDIRVIKLRMQDAFTSRPYDTEVVDILAALRADGSFGDVDYEDQTFNSGGRKTVHLQRVNTLARAYASSEGTYAQHEEVYEAICRALAFWVDRNLEDQNWWHRIIGFPKTMMVSMVLVGDDMRRLDRHLYDRCLDYLLYSWSIPEQQAQDGANGTDICKFTFAAAVVSENDRLLHEVMAKVGSLIKIAQGDREEGIQADYSFTQHNNFGRQLYLATYGREYVDGIVYFLEFVRGTSFNLDPEKVGIIERLFLENLGWCWYRGEIDVNQYGRGLLRSSSAASFLALAERLCALGTPRNEELRALSARMRGDGKLCGNRMYPCTDYMIHRPAGAMISTRMTSTRTVGNEAGNGEGLQNYHTGDGANYIKVHGDEFEGVYAGWNWKLIPGVTVMNDDREMPAPMWGKFGSGGSDYAGGVSDGRNGACAFIYAKDELEARKGWFYFDRYYVVLGAGITTARTDAAVVTCVNQTKRSGPVAVDAESPRRLWHYDVGYCFESGADVLVETGEGTYPEGYTGPQVSILRILLNHGVAPTDGTYAYAVYPGVAEADFEKCGGEYRILSNTARIQAVRDSASGKILAACYSAGEFESAELGRIVVDRPCLLLIEADGRTLRAGDPFGGKSPERGVTVRIGDNPIYVAFESGMNE